MRELVGDDGHEIAEFMFEVMNNECARTADRIEAGKWLADRGFGKAPLVIDTGGNPSSCCWTTSASSRSRICRR